MEQPPTLTDIETRIVRLEHQIGTVLCLSALNFFANLATILVAVLIAA